MQWSNVHTFLAAIFVLMLVLGWSADPPSGDARDTVADSVTYWGR